MPPAPTLHTPAPKKKSPGASSITAPNITFLAKPSALTRGYKPEDVQCWIDAMRAGTWPKRSWREQGGDACYVTTKAGNRILRGACKMKPIIDSPCRYLGRIEPGHCFLRTYTYLLAQHRALLAWGS